MKMFGGNCRMCRNYQMQHQSASSGSYIFLDFNLGNRLTRISHNYDTTGVCIVTISMSMLSEILNRDCKAAWSCSPHFSFKARLDTTLSSPAEEPKDNPRSHELFTSSLKTYFQS